MIRLETRPPNIEGKGEITQRDLVRNSLRMRPDRIIVGEVRGQEAFDMLQAMNTGHDGSLTTIHANSPRDALMRLESMVAMASFEIPAGLYKKIRQLRPRRADSPAALDRRHQKSDQRSGAYRHGRKCYYHCRKSSPSSKRP